MDRREFLKVGAALPLLGTVSSTQATEISHEDFPKRSIFPDSFSAPILITDVPNKNGRVYPRSVIEKELPRLKSLVETRSLLGMVGFPDDNRIPFSDVSHVVTKLNFRRWDLIGKYVLDGKIEVLKTPCGRVLRKMLENYANSPVTLRPFGVGSGRMEDGVFTVDNSYKMISISVVFAKDAA